MKQFFAACVIFASLSAGAAIPVEQALELCRAEQNALRRLTCYDAITAENRPLASTTTAAPVAAKPQVSADTSPADSFGLEHKQVNDNAPEQLSLTVKSVSYSPHKELIVVFTNGQTWRQIGNDYYSIAAGQQHHVKRGVLNAFFLANDSNNRTIRIRREQ
jgi:hypothetical protein